MELSNRRRRQWLSRKQKQGFRGYPLATVALYGPTETTATKIAIGFTRSEKEEARVVQRLYSEDDSKDIRTEETNERISEILQELGVKSVVMTDRIIGCPHEEGTDYPEGEVCPRCPFWANRDRWTGAPIH